MQHTGGTGNAAVGDVLSGKTFSNASANGLTGTMPNKVGSATVFTPSTIDQAITQGYYGGAAGDGKVLGDADLAAANILGGVTIFGVAGSAKRSATGAQIPVAGVLHVTSLTFTPRFVMFIRTSELGGANIDHVGAINTVIDNAGSRVDWGGRDTANFHVDANGFSTLVGVGGVEYTWWAWE